MKAFRCACDEKLTAFPELESAICACGFQTLMSNTPTRSNTRTSAQRAADCSGDVADVAVKTFLRNNDFPGTRKYIDSIIERYRFYQQRGRM
jgi:hypothetical protein